METWVQLLQYLVTAGFSVLSLITLGSWLQHRDRQHGFVALSVGLLGLVSILGRLQAPSGNGVRLLSDLTLIGFIGSGLALLLLRDASMPLPAWVRRGAVAIAAAASAFIVGVRLPLEAGSEISPVQSAAVLTLMLVWTSFVGEPILRFWRAARGRSAVQRARLRAMSLAYGGILIVLLVAGSAGSLATNLRYQLAVNLFSVLLVPTLYVSLVPPLWLRRMWRSREETAMSRAIGELLFFSPDLRSLASKGIEWPERLVGGDGAIIVDARAGVLAASGMDEAEAGTIASTLGEIDEPEIRSLDDGRHVMVIPIERSKGRSSLVVIAGRFTPPFGWDELATLQRFGLSLGAALDRVELVQEVREHTSRYEALLQGVSDLGEGVAVLEGTRVVYANDAYRGIVGHGAGDIGEIPTLGSLATPGHLPPMEALAERRRTGAEKEERFTTAIVLPDGRRLELEVAIKELHLNGHAQFVELVRDITERVRDQGERERNAAQLREAQRLAQLGSWEWDIAADEITWSEELYRVYGVSPEEFHPTAENINALVHPEDLDRMLQTVRQSMESRQPFVAEHRLAAPEHAGRTIQERGAAVLGENGEIERVVGTGQDITEQKRAEDSLRAAYEREREAAERLRALDAMKGTFLTAVSHELRTPLTAVSGFALTLEQRSEALSPEDRAEMLALIGKNARKLERLLSDLLDLDRLQRGLLTPRGHPTDVGDLVRRTVDELDLTDRHIEVHASSVFAVIDPAKVERIVENLLTNSARHTPEDCPIWARVEREGDNVLIVIEDGGPGVPQELKDAIFRPFEQGPSPQVHNPGVGIGLSLVAQFAKLHGGSAWVEDREGGGASFRVLLPLEPAEDAAVIQAARAPAER